MKDAWAALIDLPSPCRDRLATALGRIGVRPGEADWQEPPSPSPSLVVVPIDGYEQNRAVAEWIGRGEMASRTVVVAPSAPTPETLRFQLQHGLLNLVSESVLDKPECLERVLRCLIFPETAFEIRSFLPEAAFVERFEIATLAQKHQIAEEVAALVGPYLADPHAVRDVYLIINELINNAFFHSFVTQSGSEKYSPRHFSQLDDTDVVFVEAAAIDGAISLAVEDNRGTLSPREVLKYMLRQSSGEGIYDSHGRGFYLVSSLVDHLSICLEHNKRSRIVTVSHAGAEQPVRMLNFFVVL